MIEWVTTFALIVLAISLLLAIYRMIVGPTVADRAVALDSVTVHSVAAIVVYSVKVQSLAFLDSALVIAILSFLATVVIAKFIVKGVIIDRERD